jgi:uncharacterized protein (DUF2267 family)
MSGTGLEVFDKTLQTTNIWLDELRTQLGLDRKEAWHVLGAVLHALRNRVPHELAIHLGAQLPLLVRGLYYDQWRSSQEPERARSLDEFASQVARHLPDQSSVAPLQAAAAVFAVLSRHVTGGQVEKLRHALPEDVRALWVEVDLVDPFLAA